MQSKALQEELCELVTQVVVDGTEEDHGGMEIPDRIVGLGPGNGPPEKFLLHPFPDFLPSFF
jgi:hypothetical protein